MALLPASVIAAAVSDTGRVRDHNEDAVWLGDRFFRDAAGAASFDRARVPGLLLAVADGVGGAAAGEVASRWVAEQMADRVTGPGSTAVGDDPDPGPELKRVAREVNRDLVDSARRTASRNGMATTYTGILFAPGGLFWLNAGDSRLYELRARSLRQISRDHTLREESGDPSIPGNIITNCYGTPNEFYLDVGRIQFVGDSPMLLLLCSDGLSDYADMGRVAGELDRVRGEIDVDPAPGPSVIATKLEQTVGVLLQLALDGGGGDNVTAMVVWLHA